MDSYRVLMVGVLLALLLSGCKTLEPAWSLSVTNWRQPFSDSDIEVLVCTGELRGSVIVDDVVNMTIAAGPEEGARDAVHFEGSLRVGDPVRLEATCTDEAGSEVGYVRVEGRVRSPEWSGHVGGTFVYPPPVSGAPGITNCLPPSEARGSPPCIVERLVTPT
jgi:hypothetical protein